MNKRAIVAGIIASLLISPLYATALQQQYLGKIQTVMSIDHIATQYHYSSLSGDNGRYLQATLDGNHSATHNIYAPITSLTVAAGTACPAGNLCAQTLHNGDVTLYQYAYNAKTNPYRAVSQKSTYFHNKTSDRYTLLSQTQYQYNVNGELTLSRLTHWLNHKKHTSTTLNQYDTLGRLVSRTQNHAETYYRYDANSNMTQRIGGSQPLSLIINGIGEATSIQTQSIRYDSNANQITSAASMGGTFHFNARNQLIAYQPSSGHPYWYTYTANGIRWAKTRTNSTVNSHYYNAGSQLLNTTQAVPNQPKTIQHYLLAKKPISALLTGQQITHPTAHYFLLGHNGTVIGHLNTDGQLVSTQQYAAYGHVTSTVIARNEVTRQSNPFGYDGEYRDAETGLNYLRARYYDPTTTRFISQDSYHLMNRYEFAKGDPVGRTDPQGHLSLQPVSNWFHKNAFSFLAGTAFGLLGLAATAAIGPGWSLMNILFQPTFGAGAAELDSYITTGKTNISTAIVGAASALLSYSALMTISLTPVTNEDMLFYQEVDNATGITTARNKLFQFLQPRFEGRLILRSAVFGMSTSMLSYGLNDVLQAKLAHQHAGNISGLITAALSGALFGAIGGALSKTTLAEAPNTDYTRPPSGEPTTDSNGYLVIKLRVSDASNYTYNRADDSGFSGRFHSLSTEITGARSYQNIRQNSSTVDPII